MLGAGKVGTGLCASALYGLVLSGGQSSRMGRDKGALAYPSVGALPLRSVSVPQEVQRSRCFRLLSEVCAEVFISCREDQASLVPEELPRIYDSVPVQGPAAGILSAFAKYSEVAWLIWACDMPLIGEAEIQYLVKKRNPLKAATLYKRTSLEPLFAIWEPQALAELQKQCRIGNSSPRRVLESLDCEVLSPATDQVLLSVDTWAEFKQLACRFNYTGI